MTKDLDEYYSNIEYKSKELAIYEDNEGNYFGITPSNLLVAVQYIELNSTEYKNAEFNGLIPKDFKANEIEIDRPVPKYEITKREADKYIITTKKEKVKQVWIVANGLKIQKAYNNKEEAIKRAKEINKEIFKISGIKVVE